MKPLKKNSETRSDGFRRSLEQVRAGLKERYFDGTAFDEEVVSTPARINFSLPDQSTPEPDWTIDRVKNNTLFLSRVVGPADQIRLQLLEIGLNEAQHPFLPGHHIVVTMDDESALLLRRYPLFTPNPK